MSEITYIPMKQKDGYITKLTHYMSSEMPKASILILHGMAEHQKRYQPFAEYLVNHQYDVYCFDHRGHGTDKKLSDLGYFASENGYQLVIDDVIAISNYLEKNKRSDKLILLGHSMGSLIARNVIQSYDKYAGVILSGTAHPPKSVLLPGLLLSFLTIKMKGPKQKSPFLNGLLFGGKKYTSLCDRTAFDWLSRSKPIVGAYIHDPYCGFVCTASFYHDLIKLSLNATNKALMNNTRKNLTLLVISGEKDPVGGYGKDVNKYLSLMNKLEFSNVTSKLYPECRHEIINELNNEEVYSDIHEWISEKV